MIDSFDKIKTKGGNIHKREKKMAQTRFHACASHKKLKEGPTLSQEFEPLQS